ncbi:antibiotic biosynthesis monooxygenase [Qipengyuania gaetbuli]|uniref:putative quinol monooxygenase n=1 Tax=Qipengyuania gaetbuli TaxID=266952 RepID=UPI001C992BAD|nr:putative quinol monooxygenase [Qipengyuania gaetbuli]MBY6014497.1 antibiotic biosynthesis monooxygenase [Qipengyuania gaetbuli]MCA0909305.1 antibiotic biosynthesis monooxygenase [Qipengyuania gaetbuli]
MIQINGTIKLGKPMDAATRKAMVEMVRASRAEDGCLDYAFAEDLADPDTLILFERWRDRDALAAHGQSAHMAEFRGVMAANPPVSREIRVYETDEGEPLG